MTHTASELHITVEHIPDMSAEDRKAITRWYREVFQLPSEDLMIPGDYDIRVWEGDKWVSVVEVVERTITVGGQPVRIGGVGGVSTFPEYRHKGYSAMALREAARLMFDDLNVEFGMLFCAPEMEVFYGKLGWQPIRERFRHVDHWDNSRDKWDEDFMILPPPGSSRQWPEGEVDLNGHGW